MNIYDVIIIGSGPAGMTTAIYMGRSGHSVLVMEQLAPGGQAALTHQIDNYPGFEEGINGLDLSMKMHKQAERFGATFEFDAVESCVYNDESKHYIVKSSLGNEFFAKAVLIATGTVSKRLKAKGEDRYFGNGIGTCAVCDGAFYKDKIVAVIGGGNSALEESLYLSNIAKKVYIIHRRDEFRAEQFVQKNIAKKDNIELILNSVVDEFLGSTKLEKILIKNVQTNQQSELPIDGVFLYVGLEPQTAFLDPSFKNEAGFLKIDSHNNIDGKGLFGAGDCCQNSIKQVVIACGEGAKVSYHIAEFLNHNQ